jgi:hypothetical protein
VLEAVTERLEELRDTYAATLEPGPAEEYELSFARAVRKRFPRVRV